MTTPAYRGTDPGVAAWARQVEAQLRTLEAAVLRANGRGEVQYLQALPSALVPDAPPTGSALVVVEGTPPLLLYARGGQWYRSDTAAVWP